MRLTSALDVEEIDVVSGGVDHSPEGHRVRDLTMEPDVLVRGEEGCHTRADNADDVPELQVSFSIGMSFLRTTRTMGKRINPPS